MADKKGEIPLGMADKWERMTKLSGQRLLEKRRRIMEAVGTRPYLGMPVSEAELLARYSQIRRDPRAMATVLQENAKFQPDGTVLVPKALIAAMTKMEAKVRQEGVE